MEIKHKRGYEEIKKINLKRECINTEKTRM
jgi:hypothetical protein